MENTMKGTKDVRNRTDFEDCTVLITVTIISIIVTVINIVQSSKKDKHQKSNPTDQS